MIWCFGPRLGLAGERSFFFALGARLGKFSFEMPKLKILRAKAKFPICAAGLLFSHCRMEELFGRIFKNV